MADEENKPDEVAFYDYNPEPAKSEAPIERGVHPYKNLRDEFAMAALPAVCSVALALEAYTRIAENSYKVADAMMKARES